LGFGFWVLGFGFWVLGFGFWVLGFGFWVLGFGFWVLGFGFWVLGFDPSLRSGKQLDLRLDFWIFLILNSVLTKERQKKKLKRNLTAYGR
jgi:hypothetical protein